MLDLFLRLVKFLYAVVLTCESFSSGTKQKNSQTKQMDESYFSIAEEGVWGSKYRALPLPYFHISTPTKSFRGNKKRNVDIFDVSAI